MEVDPDPNANANANVYVEAMKLESHPQPLGTFEDDDADAPEFLGADGLNPFLIEEILDEIFPYLDFLSLKISRRVCKLWNTISTPHFRSISYTSITPVLTTELTQRLISTLTASSIIPMSNVTFISTHRAPPPKPTKSTKSTSTSTSEVETETETDWLSLSPHHLSFFTQFGPELSSLTLPCHQTAEIGTPAFLALLRNALLNFCPNLKHLTLTHLHHIDVQGHQQALHDLMSGDKDKDAGREMRGYSGLKSLTLSLGRYYAYRSHQNARNSMILIAVLLQMTPKLEKLHADYKCGSEIFFNFLQTLRDSGIAGNLTHFTVEKAPLDFAHLQLLTEMNFRRLRVLQLDSFVDNTTQLQLKFTEFLGTVSETLEEFLLSGDVGTQRLMAGRNDRINSGLSVEFPPQGMKKLKHFENQSYESFRLGDISFLRRLPSLRSLSMTDAQANLGELSSYPWQTPWRTLFDPHWAEGECADGESSLKEFRHGLKTLHMKASFIPYNSHLHSLKRMTDFFPNLEEFQASFSLAMSGENLRKAMGILGKKGLKVLNLGFQNCTQLQNPNVRKRIIQVFVTQMSKFTKLQRLELTLEDCPPRWKFEIPLDMLHAICRLNSLTSLKLVGFKFEPYVQEGCQRLLDSQFFQWKMEDVPEPEL